MPSPAHLPDLVIPARRRILAAFIAAQFAFAIGIVWMLSDPDPDLLAYEWVLCVMGAYMFGTHAPFAALDLWRSRGVALTLTPGGLQDLRVSPVVIPWEVVIGTEPTVAGRVALLKIELSDRRFDVVAKPMPFRPVTAFVQWLGLRRHPGMTINAWGVELSIVELERLIDWYLAASIGAIDPSRPAPIDIARFASPPLGHTCPSRWPTGH